ncbi:hypothetical protein RND81_13G013200 [Saponaria officinalis]|uniref:RING-type E3 ubiquitin transferase n=1 Tax=Saponaria officinalis TaxID=3572 RepID=A0AAW1GUZ7_SAPOF
MGALGDPKTWIPYINSKECSSQICSLSCPQWCYIIFPPPPPPPPSFQFLDHKPHHTITFSPLVIAIIGVLSSAFLLVTYYAIISKYCGNSRSSTIEVTQPSIEEIEEENNINYNNENNEYLQYEPWFISTNGLDEGLVKNITMVKYKKGEGLIESVDCLICLGEFFENDYLRLLPKCSHAFHVNCIDTWLKTHSTCPLCRANVVSVFVSPVQQALPTLVVDNNDSDNNNQDQVHVAIEEISSIRDGRVNLPKCPFRSFSHLARLELRHNSHSPCDDVMKRRSISMDNFDEISVSILEHEECLKMGLGESSKISSFGNGSTSCNNSINGELLGVMNSNAMKRSFSSGRILVSKFGRKSHVFIPL